MSYPHYTPGTHPTAPTATYPYGAYTPHHGAYSQAAGAYPYQTATSYQGYAWSYPYSYMPQHPQGGTTVAQRHVPQPTTATTHIPTTTAAPAVPQRTVPTTFTSYTPAYSRDLLAPTTSTRGVRRQSNLRGLFTKELKSLMYGFGDDRNPANDTVNVMEEILIEYISDVCQQAGVSTRKSRLSIEDLRRALSRPADAKKLARMEELLFMQEDIKRARAQFEESDNLNPKGF